MARLFYILLFLLIFSKLLVAQEIEIWENYLLLNTNSENNGRGGINVVNTNSNQSFDLAQNPSLSSGLDKGVYFNFTHLPNQSIRLRNPIRLKFLSNTYAFDFNLSYAFSHKHTLTFSNRTFRYNSLRRTTTNNPPGNYVDYFHPLGNTLSLRYSTLLGEKFGLGISSNYSMLDLDGIKTHALGLNLGFDFRNTYEVSSQLDYKINAGLSFLNFNKLIKTKNWQPTILHIGFENGFVFKKEKLYHHFSIAYQLSKLMIPSSGGNNDPNVFGNQYSFVRGVFGSFSDSPEGLKGELMELDHALGSSFHTYWKNGFMINGNVGAFIEPGLGGLKRFHWGAGFGKKSFLINFSYQHQLNKASPRIKMYALTIGYSIKLDGGQKLRFN